MPERQPASPSRRRARRAATAAVLALVVLVLAWLALPRPPLLPNVGWSTAVFDAEGGLLRLTTAPDGRFRLWTPLAEIAPDVVAATLLYEDRRFHRHPGIDPLAVVRALLAERREGASTITMQLVRLRDGLDTTTIPGKLTQMLRAIQLERHYDKDEILEAYLNLAPYGANVEGVGAAALTWFGRPAAALTLPEALALAVVPQNPGARAPDTIDGRAALDAARIRLAASWPDDARAAEAVVPLHWRTRAELPFRAPQFVDALLARADIPRGGALRTTLDPAQQAAAESALQRWIDDRRLHGIDNGAILVLEYATATVRTWVGSADYSDAGISGQVDGVRASRSPGSALKPFIYAQAIDRGLIHPYTLLEDAPTRRGLYAPENFDGGFIGPVLAHEALTRSRNLPAVHLLEALGDDGLHRMLAQVGIRGLQGADHYGLALALGGSEIAMDELAALYAALAAGGLHRPLRVLVDEPVAAPQRLFSPEAAFVTLDMLREGTVLAAKTGTSWGFRDAWAVGVVGEMVVAVWVGHFDGRSNPALVGREAALPLLEQLAAALAPAATVPEPVGLELARIEMCVLGGDIAGRHCPRAEAGWYLPGVSPLRVNDVHREVPVRLADGLRDCVHRPPATRLEVHEFWPSHLRRLYERAGRVRRGPPPLTTTCNETLGRGDAPRILAPTAGVEYLQRIDADGDPVPVPLQAAVDAEVREVYWFVGRRLVGHGDAGATVYWVPEAGRHQLRVVDDHGRSADMALTVTP